MGRQTTVPHLHSELFADQSRKFYRADAFSPVYTGTQASGTRTYISRGSNDYLVINNTARTVRRFDATSGLGAFTTLQDFVPDDLHTGSAVNVLVHWATSATSASQTALWVVTYNSVASAAALADATTALGTPLVADTDSTTAYAHNISATAGTIARDTLTNGYTLDWKVQLSTLSGLAATADLIYFLGLEVRYTRRFA